MPTDNLPANTGREDILSSPAKFEHTQRVAKVFCASALVPQHLRGNNGADAVLALAIAQRMGEDPVMVFQNIYIVHGRAGWSAQYMVARANKAGVFKGRIRWKTEGVGEAMRVTAFATLADTGDVVDATVSMAMAKAEGWAKNSKYQTMGEHMLRYRAATFLIRLYCPEVMMGMQTQEELVDMGAAEGLRDVTPPATSAALAIADTGSAPAAAAIDIGPEPAPEPDAPGWFLYDGDGVQIGEHGSALEWLAEFDRNAPAATKKAERTAYYTANAETARSLLADADTPSGLVTALEARFGAAKAEVAP